MMAGDASSHEEELCLVPLSGVEPAGPPQESTGAWVARTGRAEFEVLGLERFKGQWVRMRFHLQVEPGVELAAAFV